MTRAPRWILFALLAVMLTGSLSALAAAKPGKKADRPERLHAARRDRLSRGHRRWTAAAATSTSLSTTDGTIFKGNVRLPGARAVGEPAAPTGARPRPAWRSTAAATCSSPVHGTGKAFVLRTSDASTLKALDSQPGSSPTFVNDVALAPGYAYFTDSLRPVILRVSRSGDTIGELEPWLGSHRHPRSPSRPASTPTASSASRAGACSSSCSRTPASCFGSTRAGAASARSAVKRRDADARRRPRVEGQPPVRAAQRTSTSRRA